MQNELLHVRISHVMFPVVSVSMNSSVVIICLIRNDFMV